jgi:Fe-S-cluster formation regulator IscX/YfhJ
LGSIDETPYEDILRLLKTFGWEAKCVKVLRDNQGKPINTDNEQIRNDFVSTIDKGFPIMSLGTKNHRFNAVIGYENGGSVIVCKEGIDTPDTLGGEKSSVTVSRDNWEDTITDYILLKEKNDVAPERVRFLDLLQLIVYRSKRTDKIDSKTMRVSSANVGFAAWEVYLDLIENVDFNELSEAEYAFGCYCDGLCQIAGRNSGLEYYRAVAARFPEWKPELNIAIDALDKCAKYGGFVWSLGFDRENYAEKFRDSDVRKILANEGRKAMANDMVAIEQFEKILVKEGL